MSDGMRRELVYLSSHATNRYFIPNWGMPSPTVRSPTYTWMPSCLRYAMPRPLLPTERTSSEPAVCMCPREG